MRVFVVRHGESETNKSQKWTGWLDVMLTDKGKQDARKAGAVLEHVQFDRIYASDLRRAMETAEIAIPGCRYETSPLLREIHVGSLENTPISGLTGEQRAQAVQAGYGAFGGETKAEFSARIGRFLKELEGQALEHAAVFSHGGWLRGMLDIVTGTILPRSAICCDNCTVAVFEYTNGVWRLHSWINLS